MEIRFNQLTKVYGDYTAINAPELKVPQGESFGLVGNNGAGKTTLFRCLMDLIEPTEGSVSIGDIEVQRSGDWKEFTGSYLDENFLIGHLLPEEYFDFIASLHRLSKADLDLKLSEFESFSTEKFWRKKLIRDLSKGNQKKVGIAAALLFDPKVLVLDEPFANLDPSTQIRLKELLKRLKSNMESPCLSVVMTFST